MRSGYHYCSLREDVKATVDEIKASGVKAGITIKPATPVKELIPYLELADMFLTNSFRFANVHLLLKQFAK